MSPFFSSRREGEEYHEDQILSKAVKAGRRTYFFDVRATRGDDYFLTITESRKTVDAEGKTVYDRHKIFLYKEDFDKFVHGLSETLDYIRSHRPHAGARVAGVVPRAGRAHVRPGGRKRPPLADRCGAGLRLRLFGPPSRIRMQPVRRRSYEKPEAGISRLGLLAASRSAARGCGSVVSSERPRDLPFFSDKFWHCRMHPLSLQPIQLT